MTVSGIFALEGTVRDYAWGSTSSIQSMLGLPVDGTPAAELWIGAHPGAPSRAVSTGTGLDALIAADPVAMLGPRVADEFGDTLPFLLKVLAAEKPLSIQVHPTREQARDGFAREDAEGIPVDAPERNYRDPNHKPELICALTPFEALCGFRPVEQTLDLLDVLDVPELAFVAEALRGIDPLRTAFTALLSLADPVPLVEAVTRRILAEGIDPRWWGPVRAARICSNDFPGDIGVVLGLLLNHVTLMPGEALFLSAGNVHAYLRGTGVEIMANSDNVLRCGLTPKHVDVPELLAITEFRELAEPRWAGDGGRFTVPVPDFALAQIEAPVAELPVPEPAVLLCTSGSVTVDRGGEIVELTPGRAAFLPPGEPSVAVTGDGTVFAATAGSQAG